MEAPGHRWIYSSAGGAYFGYFYRIRQVGLLFYLALLVFPHETLFSYYMPRIPLWDY